MNLRSGKKFKKGRIQIVDSEISFNFKSGKVEKTNHELELFKTMVIIYQDWFHFDIKTEKKDDYEENVVVPPVKKKKRRKRKYGTY